MKEHIVELHEDLRLRRNENKNENNNSKILLKRKL